MTEKFLVGVALVVISFCSAWERTYGGSLGDRGYSVIQTSDGGLLVAGQTESFGPASWNIYLVKTDMDGETLWTAVCGGPANDYGYSVVEASDGSGYVVAGYTDSYGMGSWDVYMVKVNHSGGSVWTKTYGIFEGDGAYSIARTSDGGYVLTGFTERLFGGLFQWDVYLLRTNSAGDTLWTKRFGGGTHDFGYSVIQSIDGGFVIAGYTRSFGAGCWDAYLIKTDASGNFEWQRTFGGSSDDYAYCVRQTPDGGYILVGSTASLGLGDEQVYLVKTDADGYLVWERNYGGLLRDGGYCVELTSDGGYIITGFNESGAYGENLYLIKVNSVGDTVWSKRYGGGAYDRGYSVIQLADVGYVVAGETFSFGSGNGDVYLIRTDSTGWLGIAENSNKLMQSLVLSVSPNPFNDACVIAIEPGVADNLSLSIYDLNGNLIDICAEGEFGWHSGKYIWTPDNSVPSGVYLVVVNFGNRSFSQRVVYIK